MEKKVQNRNYGLGILIVGMTLGTAWAVRGQFGHEQGAAWAGGIGALALVLASGRKDWYNKVLAIVISSAVGWGVTGMISYGMVVGYCRSDNFPNAFYGFLMLFVIGGLFGLLGGGLTGLSLESSEQKKVKWAELMAEMVAGGLIVYGFLVMQLGILMTPPRTEAWAICLGAGLAMLWYMARNGFRSSLRVAIFTAFGAGFGFSFGNFLQIVGNVLEMKFNMWNVMEYSIGFFGGSALAYSIFSSVWPENVNTPKPWENRIALFFVFVFIPLIIFRESLQYNLLVERVKEVVNPERVARLSNVFVTTLLVVLCVMVWYRVEKKRFSFDRKFIRFVFVAYFITYIILSFVVSGLFAGNVPLNHWLYLVNFIMVLLLLELQKPVLFSNTAPEKNNKHFIGIPVFILIVLVLLTFIAIGIHGEMYGAHDRFPLD
jgi:hypothetical protein